MWQKVLVKCPIQGSTSPTTFFSYPKGKQDPPKWAHFKEIREAWTKLLPEELSAADRLNGVQFRGFALLGGSATRSFPQPFKSPEQWEQWEDISKDKPNTATFYRKATEIEWLGVFISIEQRDQHWSFRVHEGGFVHRSFDPDSMAADKRSCAVLTTANPLKAP
jgi:hypothetical protein